MSLCRHHGVVRPKGLCGNFDGNMLNDYVRSDGAQDTSVVDFAISWKTDPSCPDPAHGFPEPRCLRSCALETTLGSGQL